MSLFLIIASHFFAVCFIIAAFMGAATPTAAFSALIWSTLLHIHDRLLDLIPKPPNEKGQPQG